MNTRYNHLDHQKLIQHMNKEFLNKKGPIQENGHYIKTPKRKINLLSTGLQPEYIDLYRLYQEKGSMINPVATILLEKGIIGQGRRFLGEKREPISYEKIALEILKNLARKKGKPIYSGTKCTIIVCDTWGEITTFRDHNLSKLRKLEMWLGSHLKPRPENQTRAQMIYEKRKKEEEKIMTALPDECFLKLNGESYSL